MKKRWVIIMTLLFLIPIIFAGNNDCSIYGNCQKTIATTGGGNVTNYINNTYNNNSYYSLGVNNTQMENATIINIKESWLNTFFTNLWNSLFPTNITYENNFQSDFNSNFTPVANTSLNQRINETILQYLNTGTNASYLTTYNSTYHTWAFNQSALQGNYYSTNSTFNSTYDNFKENVSRNWTLDSYNNWGIWWFNQTQNLAVQYLFNQTGNIQGNYYSTNSTFNATYDSYKTNVSKNWTQETFNAYNSSWVQFPDGNGSYQNVAQKNQSNIFNGNISILSPNSLNVSNFLFANSTNVGIGTTNPLRMLQLTGAIPEMIFNDTDRPNVNFHIGLMDTSSGGFHITETGVATRFFIQNTSGNVGIGTTSPVSTLDISGNFTVTGTPSSTYAIKVINSTGTTDQYFYINTNGFMEKYRNDAGVTNDFLISQAGTGDPVLEWRIVGIRRWAAGIDNSDSDKFKISPAADLTNGVFTIDTSGNVGIGTTTPGAHLQVGKASDSASAGTGLIVYGGDNGAGTTIANFKMYSDASVFYIRGDGNVGIGTTTPTATLTVNGSSSGEVGININNTNPAGYSALRLGEYGKAGSSGFINIHALGQGYTTSGAYIASGGNVDGNGIGGLTISTSNSIGNMSFFSGGVAAGNERMRITSGGNVGIGTTSPLNKLDVIGDGLRLSNSGTSDAILRFDFDGVASDTWKFQTVNHGTSATGLNTAMVIRTNGQVGIGTTSPQATLHVDNAANGPATIRVSGQNNAEGINITANGASGHSYIDSTIDNSGYNMYFRMRTLGTPVNALTLLGTGNVGIGTTSPTDTLNVVGTVNFSRSGGLGTILMDSNGRVILGPAAKQSSSYPVWIDSSDAVYPTLLVSNTRTSSSLGMLVNAGSTTNQEAILQLNNATLSIKFVFKADGEAYCYGTDPCWNFGSSKNIKNTLIELNSSNNFTILGGKDILTEFRNTPVYSFKYNGNNKTDIGLIAEYAPDLINGQNKSFLSAGAMANYLWVVGKAQDERITQLEKEITGLKSEKDTLKNALCSSSIKDEFTDYCT